MPDLSLKSQIPEHEYLLELEPEELGGILLGVLRESGQTKFNLYGTVFQISHEYTSGGLPHHIRYQIAQAIAEGWSWLEREGLLIPSPEENERLWFIISRRGGALQNATEVEAFRKAKLLPAENLHPAIAGKVSPLFMRGEYPTAVFQDFKEVEVAVREAGGFDSTDLGTDLIRKAFHPDNGPLTNPSLPKPEREAITHLFAGAIGRYKNPHSHRNEPLQDPIETVEILLFASQLLRIVDAARERLGSP